MIALSDLTIEELKMLEEQLLLLIYVEENLPPEVRKRTETQLIRIRRILASKCSK